MDRSSVPVYSERLGGESDDAVGNEGSNAHGERGAGLQEYGCIDTIQLIKVK